MNKSESIVEISKAMAGFQADIKQPFRDKKNPFFGSSYVPLESVVEAITSIAPKHGLSFTQWALNDDNGQIGVATLLMHESGEFIEYDPVFMKAEKQTPQGYGALITYLKRYTLSAIFGITSDEDDDGNNSSKNELASDKQLDMISTLMRNVSDDKQEQLKYFNGLIAKKGLTNKMVQWTSKQADEVIKQVKSDLK